MKQFKGLKGLLEVVVMMADGRDFQILVENVFYDIDEIVMNFRSDWLPTTEILYIQNHNRETGYDPEYGSIELYNIARLEDCDDKLVFDELVFREAGKYE